MLNRVKTSVHGILRQLGFDVVSSASARPSVPGSATILGSFPPFEHYYATGPKENYFIREGYQHRTTAVSYDATAENGVWQLEIYKFAREVFDKYVLSTVCDFGCGSGRNLVTYFGDTFTIGIDVPETCKYLRRKWPERCWMDVDYEATFTQKMDLVIVADVIEHVDHPNELLMYITKLQPSHVVLSTPDRNLIRNGTCDGPPGNPAHIREWSFVEFHAYVSQFFDIKEHFISCAAQATQCVLCVPRQ